jgi:hypothetical protein
VTLTPAALCRGLLEALDASEGRRKRRVRNTTADSIGFAIQRELLEAAVRDEPTAEDFEGWLHARCLDAGPGDGGHRAMALLIWNEWMLASKSEGVGAWLATGARSDDRGDT